LLPTGAKVAVQGLQPLENGDLAQRTIKTRINTVARNTNNSQKDLRFILRTHLFWTALSKIYGHLFIVVEP
jgi:hypothetical protein